MNVNFAHRFSLIKVNNNNCFINTTKYTGLKFEFQKRYLKGPNVEKYANSHFIIKGILLLHTPAQKY